MSNFPALDDFNEFSGPSSGDQGDFLARERELLGDEFGPTPTNVPNVSELSKGSGGAAGAFPDLDDEFGGPAPSRLAGGNNSNDFVSSFERDPPKNSNSASVAIGDDDDDDADLMGGAGSGGNDEAVQQFTSQYPDLQLYPAQDQYQQQAPAASSPNGYSGQTSSYAQPSYSSNSAPTEPESEAIRAWREKQQGEIQRRDAASAERKEEIVRKAEKAIDDFYETYNQKKEKQIATNKENEAAFIQARDDALGKGTTWERIADMIELQDSRSKTAARGTRDMSRMKEVLLSLKREGENAPNAMGY